MKPFYVTTPIYYVNDKPHIGHAYSTVVADVLARFHRLRGQPTRFLTGLDEHGLKIERRAQELGKDPKAFVDGMVPPFTDAWQILDITNDDFIRTTEDRHKEAVQRLWKRLEDNGDIYLGHYEDWYCVGCESFKTEKELLEGNLCPDHKKPVEKIKEASYFFRLSKYTEPLLAYYEKNPDFVKPEGRFNEVKAFVREGLRDLSISRSSFAWGVPVPDDAEHVMYVWLDALTNYISALGGPDNDETPKSELYERFWGDDGRVIHIVGKDILRFHTVFWPAFLLSAGIRLPDQVWAHGWLTVNGEKMSKGLGNFLPPAPLVEAFGADVLRYYFLREVSFGQDGDFSHENLIARYNGELGNGLGNLLNRILPFIKKRFDGKVPEVDVAALPEDDKALIATVERLAKSIGEQLDDVQINRALDGVKELLDAANRYVNDQAPWNLSKDESKTGRLAEVSYVVLETLRFLSVILAPILPNKCNGLREQIGLDALEGTEGSDAWPSTFGGLTAGTELRPGQPLFPRIDNKQKDALLAKLVPGAAEAQAEKARKKAEGKPNKGQKKAKKKEAAETPEGIITFDDFIKVELRVGHIKEAAKVPKKDRLLQLTVDLGEEKPRNILAGIAEHYAPEDLVDQRVLVVANLAPRKMAGTVSEGMILATDTPDGGVEVVTVSAKIAAGTRAG